MKLRIAIYTENAHMDILLPAINNADFSQEIPQRQFGLRRPLKLELEVLDEKWAFKKSTQYSVKKDRQDWEGKPLAPGDRLSVSAGRVAFSLIVIEQSDMIGSFQKFNTQRLRELTIGKDPDCDICYNRFEIISRHHISIYFQRDSATVEDFSVNGVYLNGSRIRGRTSLRFGDTLSVYGMTVVYLTDMIAVNIQECGAVLHQRMEGFLFRLVEPTQELNTVQESTSENLFHRSPRKMIQLYTEGEEIEAPPQKQSSSKKPVWMIIGPSFTMAIPMLLGCGFMILARSLTGSGSNVFMYVGLVTALSSAIIGITWALINLNYSKKEEKETELLRMQKYGDYLMESAERIRQKYEHNRQALLEMYPSAENCCSYWRNTQLLWSRNRSHKDFMSYRLGLGDIPFQVPITIPKKRFTLSDDDLTERPGEIRENYARLTQVPIVLDLYKHRIVGVIGPEREEIVRTIAAQIAANNCYTDLRLVLLADEGSEQQWKFAKWLPHVWNAERTRRYTAFGKQEVSSVCYELANLFRSRAEANEGETKRKGVLPVQYVVLVENIELLQSEPITKYLFDQPEELGVTTLLMADIYENLPNSCDFVLEHSQSVSGMYSMAQDGEEAVSVTFDHVSVDLVEQLARNISGIRVIETESGDDIPDSLTFFDMLGVSRLSELQVLDNWRKNRTYESMQAMVGWKAGNIPCYLNIHEKFHGPHGLVAGTTGSGKSETLQTYILSLAINYSPQDVGFFIIDFKGGGMANCFSNLPHMLGSISNLSGNQVRRAMVSIRSENVRRQRIFNEYGINHIDAYTRLVKNKEASLPLPHLFIIIDEFAELKREEPEFMRELISVAQVGRSLGVHLILATQKPSGTVDDNIWSNTKFRLCLRVADKQDSRDMLHKTDAAYLTQAGRCYLQVGNDEIYELFQSGWSGAIYDESANAAGNAGAVMLDNTGKTTVAGNSTKAKKTEQKKLRWIRQLVECCGAAKKQAGDDQTLLDEIFHQLQLREIDYADNDYNRRQLASFLIRYQSLLERGEGNIAKRILESAAERGEKLPELKDKTQLDAVVDYLAELAQTHNYLSAQKLWMPVLPEHLLLDSIDGAAQNHIPDGEWDCAAPNNTLCATIGMADDPQNQTQFPLSIDFMKGGHLAVCGAVSSGKSTLLQTMVFDLVQRYTPDMLNVYMIDYSSQMLAPFESLPHSGGIVYEGETDKLEKLFLLLSRTLKERKALFRGGSFLQYITVHGNVVPAILLVLDGYAGFREKTENAYEDRLLELARDGAGFGIFMCISAGGFGTGEIQAKLGDKLRQVLCLEMDSKYSYGDCLRTMQFDVLPESGVHGRGLAICGESVLEYQTAIALDGNDYQRGEAITERCRKLAELWHGKRAEQIPVIPQNPVWENFSNLEEYRKHIAVSYLLPVAYRQKDASLYDIDLNRTYCYLISGRERSGKSVFLRNVACAAHDRGARIFVVDKIGVTKEKRTAELVEAEYVNSHEQMFQLWKTLILLINDRHVRQKQLVERGLEDTEIFEGMADYQQVYVLIADLPDFIQACANPGAGRQPISAQVENILKKGAQHQVYFFGAITTQDITAASAQGIYRSFTQTKQGVHLGGELNAQKMLSYKNIAFLDQGKRKNPGSGYVPDPEDSGSVEEIIIPMNKGTIPEKTEQGNA